MIAGKEALFRLLAAPPPPKKAKAPAPAAAAQAAAVGGPASQSAQLSTPLPTTG